MYPDHWKILKNSASKVNGFLVLNRQQNNTNKWTNVFTLVNVL